MAKAKSTKSTKKSTKKNSKKSPEKSAKKAPAKRKERSSAFVLFYAVGIIILLIIILFALPGVFNLKQMFEDRYTYNYFDFVKEQGTWFTTVKLNGNLLNVGLRYGPLELEGIPVTGDIAQFRDSYSFYYITFDPSSENHDRYVTMSNAEVSINLVVHFKKSIEPGCTKENDVCNETNTSIVTCSNTNEGVIFLNHAPGPKIEVRGNCAIITGEGPDMVRAADRLMYGMYGVMK